MTIVTLELLAGKSADGVAVREEVRAKPLGELTFEIVQSPGLVLGIAAGDVITLSRSDQSNFSVVRRGGNLCIQIFSPLITDQMVDAYSEALGGIGGRLDGRSPKEIVFTVPVSVGFKIVESVLALLISRFPTCEWFYGNVYAPDDGVSPLNWWESS